MKNASNTVKGYAFSMTPSREYLSDDMQTAIDTMFKTFPTGDKCNTYYYRFYKTDIKSGTGDCIRLPVTVCPSSTGGSGGDTLTSSIQINGNGEVEQEQSQSVLAAHLPGRKRKMLRVQDQRNRC